MTFTVKLNSQPMSNVTIPISSNDTTEGTVSTSELTFTAANWSVLQTVTVTGVDDLIVDGNILYTIIIGAATSSDLSYNGLNPADVGLTNLDNDAIPTKFYVVDDATSDRTYEYGRGGTDGGELCDQQYRFTGYCRDGCR